MAPEKKGQSKKRDRSPKPPETSSQNLGFTLSPKRTPKKLLRNKKRKELIESLSPSPQKKSKSSHKSSKGSQSSTKKAAAASGSASILSFFTKAKPVQYVQCPVCSEEVAMLKINRHLDSNCGVKEEDKKSGCSSNTTGASSSKDSKNMCMPKSEKKSNTEISPCRKRADLKNENKNKRTRQRLQKKIKSHILYQHTISVTDSSDSVTVTTSESEIPNQSDTDSTSDMQSRNGVEMFTPVEPNKKVHRELFFDDDNNNSKLSKGKGETKSKLSLKKKRMVEMDKTFKTSSKTHTQTEKATECQSSYWSLSSTSSSSEDCVIVRHSPGKEKLSLSQKISLQLSPVKIDKQAPSRSELAVPSSSKQLNLNSSSSSKSHPDESFTQRTRRTPKKLTPVCKMSNVSPNYEASLKSRHCNVTNDDNNAKNSSPTKSNHVDAKAEGNILEHSKYTSSSSGKPSSNLSKRKPVLSPVQSLPHNSSPSKFSQQSLFNKNKLPNSPTTGGVNSPISSRKLYSPSRYKASTSRHNTPVSSPLKSSQGGSPAPSSASSTNSPSKRDPYFLANFKLILLSVLGCEDDRSLFSEEDLAYVETFKKLSGPAQQLYVRLFLRKHAWLRASKIDYPKIAVDLKPFISELQQVNLLQSEKELNNIEEALNLLAAPDVKTLAKSLKVSAGGSQKSELVPALLKHARHQRSIFNVSMQQVVMKKACGLLGSCVRLSNEPRTVFSRITLLFSLAVNLEDEEQASGGQTQMQTLLMVNMGRVCYPAYTIFRTRKIFSCRDDLIRYEEANQYELDIQAAMGTNDFELALQIQQAAKEKYETLQENQKIFRHNQSLPPFLRHFTASWLYTRLLYLGVEIHQKMRCYEYAVTELRSLLEQSEYCMDSRGRWWDRLALNLDQHLKKPNEALDTILEGLADPYVRSGHRLALQQRAQKIFKSKQNKKLLHRMEEFSFDEIRELPKVTIRGQVLPFQAPGVKNTFVRRLQTSYTSPSRRDEGDMAICTVEQVALQHYKETGFEEGVHGEGTIFSTLIFLLFWDVIFMSGIPDVFSYPYQSAPLDIRYSSFYDCRKDTIDEKLKEVSVADTSTLQTSLESKWRDHEGETALGVNWELFKDVQHAKGLLACIGGNILSAIAARILKDHRHTRAGMPDLTVWNTKTNKYKVVEVKGPGDRLSHKQILWIDYLLSHGVDTEVCHVEASSKRLRLT